MFVCILAQGLSGLYKLSCYSFLALVNKEGKASGVYTDGACTDGACPNKACVDRAYANGAIVGYRCTSNCTLSPLFYLLCPSLAYALISNILIIIGRPVAVYIRVGGFIKVCIHIYYTSGKPY